LRGVDSVGVENCPFPLTKPDAINTGLALPRSLWCHLQKCIVFDSHCVC